MKSKLAVVFYRSESGREPVRDWLKRLKQVDKKIIGEDIKTLQFGWPIGMPLVRSLAEGIWEIRSSLSDKRIARILLFMDTNIIVLLNAFIKKTQKTPKVEIDIALKRKRQYLSKK